MIGDYSRFKDLGIPMLEELADTKAKPRRNENVLAKYEQFLKNNIAIQFVPTIVGSDGSLRRLEGGYEVVLPAKEIYEGQVLSAEDAAKYIGRHFTCEVSKITDSVIEVSHIKALFGDGSTKEKAVRRMRAVTGEALRKMKPFIPELRQKAAEWTKAYVAGQKEAGATYSEQAMKNITERRYHLLYEQKKDEAGVERCIVPATVEDVRRYQVVLNIFNLDIMGTCSRASWARGRQALDLRDQVHVGDIVEVEVLSFNPNGKSSNTRIPGVWICSRKSVSDRMDEKNFLTAVTPYAPGCTVQVICEKLGFNTTRRWIGHIKGTDVKVAAKYGPRNIGVFVGGTYVVQITGVSENRLMLDGRTKGFVMNSGGVYIPKRRQEQSEPSTKDEDAFFAEEPLADSMVDITETTVAAAAEPPAPEVVEPPVAEKPAAAEVAPPAEPVINKKATAAATISIPQVATPKSISIEDLISAPNGNKE